MKLTVLCDNNTYIDQYYLGEPALCFYIEDENRKILLDAGYSSVFKKNAALMNLDLNQLTDIVISHGHNDHTRGLKYLLPSLKKDVTLTVHPHAFKPKYDGEEYIGAPFSKDEILSLVKYRESFDPVSITSRLIFLGQIPRKTDFEAKNPIGCEVVDGERKPDFLIDDSALVYKSDKGLFVITGCSHSGICNIIEYAKEVCGEDRIIGCIGGFHIFDDEEQIRKTLDYFCSNNIQKLYPCHCVSLKAKCEFMKALNVEEVGVGLKIEVV
ncbi:MBL fold metallo-hydrolase [Succinivibrio sp.]|uniref:MBL fold metallo-hydrolase n=1 Tax=Succinivibrio sp. TaxID=2053619 RepID=UPI00386DC980